MRKTIKTKSTSRKSAVGTDIVLRKTKITRLIFRPEIVENPHNPEASVRGTFIFQKKGISGDWSDYRKLTLSKLKDAEWFKLELHSGELFTLITQLNHYYEIFKRYGIVVGEKEFLITPRNISSIIQQLLDDKDNLNSLIKQGGLDLLPELINWLSQTDDMQLIFDKLKILKIDNLRTLNSILGISNLKNILNIWRTNKYDDSEEFWQKTLKENSWVIAQVFAFPVIIYRDKAYVGGKFLDNKGGNIVDFLYKNSLTDNIMLIEIKTPTTKLIGNKYRNNVYSTSADLSGSVSQILNYKTELERNYNSFSSRTTDKFLAFNPKCMVIIGSLGMKGLNELQKKSFELFRNDLRNVEIITFDELFHKIQLQLNMLENVIPKRQG